jgi:biopolymer transport protein ExbB
MSLAYIIHLANYSDGVLYALAVLLLVALAVTFDRSWFLRRTILAGDRLVRRVAEHEALGASELAALEKEAGKLPEAVMLATARQYLDLPREALSDRLEESIMLLAPRIDSGLWVLDTIVTLSPLLGLFGTILGMFHAFSILATPGHAPTAITAGVADALIATACGIFIALIGLVAFNGLSNRVRLVVLQLDTVKTMVMNRTSAMVAGRDDGAAPPARTLHAVAGE